MSLPNPKMIQWTWRNGSATDQHYQPMRSPRIRPVEPSAEVAPQTEPTISSTQGTDFSFKRTNNKREDTCTKMSERQMVPQVGMNPFMTTDYVKGLEIRDKFLIPAHESKPGNTYDPNTTDA